MTKIDEDLRDDLMDMYVNAVRDYLEYQNDERLSRFYEGRVNGIEAVLTRLGVLDRDDIREIYATIREDLQDEYAVERFYHEHGFYPEEMLE